MITVANAQTYTMKNGAEMAYEIEYSDGTKIRTVESTDRIIRTEYKVGDVWKQSGKPYVVAKNKNRNAEQIKARVIEFIARGTK